MADKIVQLKDKDGTAIFPIAACPASFDYRYAPISVGVSVEDGSALSDAQCIFNFTNIGGDNQYETKIFANAKITDPVSSSVIYGVMETKEYISDGNLFIEQIFKRKQYDSIGDQQVFKRLGYIQNWTGDKYTGVTSASITWKAWYPLEYPLIDLNDGVRVAVRDGICIVNYVIENITVSSFGQLIKTLSGFEPPIEYQGTMVHQWGTSLMGSIYIGSDGTLRIGANNGSYQGVRANLSYPLGY